MRAIRNEKTSVLVCQILTGLCVISSPILDNLWIRVVGILLDYCTFYCVLTNMSGITWIIVNYSHCRGRKLALENVSCEMKRWVKYSIMRNHIEIVYIIMTLGSLLAKHTSNGKKTIRNIESISKKIINAEAAVIFNNHCIDNNMLPKYTKYISRIWMA